MAPWRMARLARHRGRGVSRSDAIGIAMRLGHTSNASGRGAAVSRMSASIAPRRPHPAGASTGCITRCCIPPSATTRLARLSMATYAVNLHNTPNRNDVSTIRFSKSSVLAEA